mmetsp:Transcript_30839/g.98341  ORF Transcript_30839/g.98341 Transcript_30839/m.98341 type:complete len:343 (+) Transcript_30839:92-1120(+)
MGGGEIGPSPCPLSVKFEQLACGVYRHTPRGVQHVALRLPVALHDPMPIGVKECHRLGAGVIMLPGVVAAVHKGEDIVSVVHGKPRLLLHAGPVDANVSALRQCIKHLCCMARRPIGTDLVRRSANRVVPWRVPEHPNKGLATAVDNVLGQGSDLASPQLVCEHLMKQLKLALRECVVLLQAEPVCTLDAGQVTAPQELAQGLAHRGLGPLAPGEDPPRLVLRDREEHGHLVPPAHGNQLPRLPRHVSTIHDCVPAQKPWHLLPRPGEREERHAHGVLQPARRADVAGQFLSDPVCSPHPLRWQLLQAVQHILCLLLLAAQPVDHELSAFLVHLARPYVRRR